MADGSAFLCLILLSLNGIKTITQRISLFVVLFQLENNMATEHSFENIGALRDIAEKYGMKLPDSIELNNSESRASFYSAMVNNITSLFAMENQNAFNAEQAQISRDWNSEQAVMDRRREAGLNAINPSGASMSGSGGGSGAVAQGANVPTMSMPQMQMPDYGGIMQGAVALAKAPSEILEDSASAQQSLASIDKLQAETDLAMSQKSYTDILTRLKPQEVQSVLDYQASLVRHNEADINRINALCDYYEEQTIGRMFDSVLGIQGAELDVDTAIRDLNSATDRLQVDSDYYAKQLLERIYSGSYQYGKSIGNSSGGFSTRNLGTDTVNFHAYGGGVNFYGNQTPRAVPIKGFGPQLAGFKMPKIDLSPLLGGLSGGGGATDTESITTYNSLQNTNMTNRITNMFMQDKEYYENGAKIVGTLKVIRSAQDYRVRHDALTELKGLTRAFNIYERLRNMRDRSQSANYIQSLPQNY